MRRLPASLRTASKTVRVDVGVAIAIVASKSFPEQVDLLSLKPPFKRLPVNHTITKLFEQSPRPREGKKSVSVKSRYSLTSPRLLLASPFARECYREVILAAQESMTNQPRTPKKRQFDIDH